MKLAAERNDVQRRDLAFELDTVLNNAPLLETKADVAVLVRAHLEGLFRVLSAPGDVFGCGGVIGNRPDPSVALARTVPIAPLHLGGDVLEFQVREPGASEPLPPTVRKQRGREANDVE